MCVWYANEGKKRCETLSKNKKLAAISNFICAQQKIIYSCAKVVGTQYNQPTPTSTVQTLSLRFKALYFRFRFVDGVAVVTGILLNDTTRGYIQVANDIA